MGEELLGHGTKAPVLARCFLMAVVSAAFAM